MYRKLGLSIAINTVIMFLLTYVMIERMAHFHVALNRAYMALLMAMPMVVIMLVLMRSMFEDARLNRALLGGSLAAFVLLLFLTRTQTPIGNGEFLRSMIPHHSSAILMCEESSIDDAQIIELCGEIVQTQREEIAEMESILDRL